MHGQQTCQLDLLNCVSLTEEEEGEPLNLHVARERPDHFVEFVCREQTLSVVTGQIFMRELNVCFTKILLCA